MSEEKKNQNSENDKTTEQLLEERYEERVASLKELYENTLNEVKKSYEQQIKDIKEDLTSQIKDILTQGKVPPPDEKSEETETDEVEEAVQRLKKINISNYFSIVLSSSQWDSGVLGIVAAKLANMYNRPTILFSQEGELLKGSARSINNIDIHSIITDVKEVVEAFGGHKMAAGLTIKYKNYKKFINSVNYKLIHKYKPQDFVPVDENYITIEPTAVDYSLYKDLCVLEPFGIGNEKPVFRIKSDKVNVSTMPKYPNHLTINSNNLSIIAFNSSQYLPLLKNTVEQNIDIELQLNTFKNKNIVKGIAKKISTGYITKQNDDFLYGQYIKQLCFNTNYNVKCETYKNENINLLLKNN